MLPPKPRSPVSVRIPFAISRRPSREARYLYAFHLQYPGDIVALVPNGETIPARDSDRIYSVELELYREIPDPLNPGQKTYELMTDENGDPYTEDVYNQSNEAVEGPRYVVTSVTTSGTRYVVLEPCNAD
jgi:hypothetical protein